RARDSRGGAERAWRDAIADAAGVRRVRARADSATHLEGLLPAGYRTRNPSARGRDAARRASGGGPSRLDRSVTAGRRDRDVDRRRRQDARRSPARAAARTVVDVTRSAGPRRHSTTKGGGNP